MPLDSGREPDMSLTPELEVKPGDLIAGKYRVDRLLGQGGMGVVVAATHTVLGEQVALKFLLPGLQVDEKIAERFLREAKAAAKIKSPHVARVVDVGTMLDTGSPYIVMELMSGHDLGVELEQRGALELEQACSLAIQACEALASAHQAGVIHRDIKPGNLFLTQDADGTPLLKVLDFGISKLESMDAAALTQTQTAMGSPLYMSPEQMRSARQVDQRTDIWSLGIVLYELITGEMPYMAETLPQLCALVLEAAPPSIRSIVPGVPLELEELIARCLSKDPADRFATMAELALALAPFAGEAGEREALRVSRILGIKGTDNNLIAEESAPSSSHRGSLGIDSQEARASTQVLASNEGVTSSSISQEASETSAVGHETGLSFGRTEHSLPSASSRGMPFRLIAGAVVVLAHGFFAYVWNQEQGSSNNFRLTAQPVAPIDDVSEVLKAKASAAKRKAEKILQEKLIAQKEAEIQSQKEEKLRAEQLERAADAQPLKQPVKKRATLKAIPAPKAISAPKAPAANKSDSEEAVFDERL